MTSFKAQVACTSCHACTSGEYLSCKSWPNKLEMQTNQSNKMQNSANSDWFSRIAAGPLGHYYNCWDASLFKSDGTSHHCRGLSQFIRFILIASFIQGTLLSRPSNMGQQFCSPHPFVSGSCPTVDELGFHLLGCY